MWVNRLNIASKYSSIIAILLMATIFAVKASTFIDPDFGWHLKMGELILKQGIPKTDPFSYTMPNFPFVDHEWLTNIIYYYLYQTVGRTGIAVLLTIIGLITILIIKSQNQSKFFLAPLLLTLTILLPFWGVRPQVETWFFIALGLTIIGNDSLWVKWKWLSPFYFLLWANLHGGFVVGLVILLLFLGFKSFTQRKIAMGDLILAALCLGATLTNPYGVNLWKEVLQQIFDSNLRWSIMEWTPLLLDLNVVLALSTVPLLTLSGVLIYYFRAKLASFQTGLYLLSLLAGLLSQRHIPIWALIALPLTSQALEWLYENIKPNKLAQKRFNNVYRVLLIASAFFLILQVTLYLWNLRYWKEEGNYPKQAIQQLQKQPLEGKLFSSYGWGGYLIWQLPQQKVFVDGRMPSWRWQSPHAEESPAAFDEYNKVINDPNGLQILDKYQVQLILWPAAKKEENWLAKIFPAPTIPSFENRLKQAHWQKIYQDQTATIYQRPPTPSP